MAPRAMHRLVRPADYFDRAEGERTWPEDDLDVTPAEKAASAKQLVDDLADVSTTEDEDDAPDPSIEATQGIHTEPASQSPIERIENRKLSQTHRTGGNNNVSTAREPVLRKRRNKRSDAIVGRRKSKKARRTQQGQLEKEAGAGGFTSSDENDEDAFASRLPEYIKERRAAFDGSRSRLGSAGLRLPPTFDDIEFSEDEDLESLQERPVFPIHKAEPQAPYEDIVLKYSAGTIPAPIAQYLRSYQVEGAEYLHELFVYQKGGLLGDDMGLGKTIQVIAFLTAAFGKTGDQRDAKRMRKIRKGSSTAFYPRVLIICPGGLMENWKSEFDRWGWWHIGIYHGNKDERESTIIAARFGRLEVLITTYSTFLLNASELNSVNWDCVIADEVHTIKNRRSRICQALNEVNSLSRIGLTGTAIQNNYDELWTLLNWTNPGRFGVISAWKNAISKPLQIGQSHGCSNAELMLARTTAAKLVNNLLPPFFLRRMKSLIAHQLPKKKDRVVFCPLTERQADAYETFVNCELVETIRRSAELCDCRSGKKRGWCCHQTTRGVRWQNLAFPAIATLQKLSNHLALLIPNSLDERDRQAKDLDNLQQIFPGEWRQLYESRDKIVNYANPEFCGKWQVLKRLLQFWHSAGDKVLVFSHSVRLLKMLQMLFNATTTYNVSFLDGSMNYGDRSKTVDEFNTDPRQFVFLISTRAGGVGLNITSANKVVIFDPNWNPSYDLQAQDRAYRIGQVRDVEVFRLVSAGTIEEIVYARQIYKQQQANIGYTASKERRYFDGVQDSKERKGEIFGLANIFSFHGENVVLRDIVNKTEIAEIKAGVNVVGLDLESTQELDEDDEFPLSSNGSDREDSAMSQLAAFISEGDDARSKRLSKKEYDHKAADPIQAILASAGVTYSHDNAEVVGSSRIETKLSRRAEEAGDNRGLGDQNVFDSGQKRQVHMRPTAVTHVIRGAQPNANDGRVESRPDAVARTDYLYHPPDEVKQRQFCSMAEMFGYADRVTEFALAVESWSSKQRRHALEKFYGDVEAGKGQPDTVGNADS